MTVETKYSIKDKIYFMSNNKVTSGPIYQILISITEDEYNPEQTQYYIETQDDKFILQEDEMYLSKEELLKSL
jgi:hypothetical protein